MGVKKILAAMQINGVDKLVRITGALTDKNEFKFFVYLFNLLLRKSTKWHEASEIAIRNSDIDYTVIRPTELKENDLCENSKMKLVIKPGDDPKGVKVPSSIPISCVAGIFIKMT